MSAKGAVANAGNLFVKVVLGLIALGFLFAILQAFNFNLFWVFEWIWSWFSLLIGNISDFFSGNDTFRTITQSPE